MNSNDIAIVQEAFVVATTTFREYSETHALKGTAAGDEKSARNRALCQMMHNAFIAFRRVCESAEPATWQPIATAPDDEYHIVGWRQRLPESVQENLVRVAESYLRKGSKVYLEGALQTRKWVDQSGAEKYTTEIVLQRYRGELTMLDGRSGDDYGSDEAPY